MFSLKTSKTFLKQILVGWRWFYRICLVYLFESWFGFPRLLNIPCVMIRVMINSEKEKKKKSEKHDYKTGMDVNRSNHQNSSKRYEMTLASPMVTEKLKFWPTQKVRKGIYTEFYAYDLLSLLNTAYRVRLGLGRVEIVSKCLCVLNTL